MKNKKQYLLSWYGVSDFTASLENNAYKGPLCSILLEGQFDEAHILAYTNSEKDIDKQNTTNDKLGQQFNVYTGCKLKDINDFLIFLCLKESYKFIVIHDE